MATIAASSSPLRVAAADVAPLQVIAQNAGLDFTSILNDLQLPAELGDKMSNASAPLEDYFRILARLSFAAQDETCQLSSRPLMPGTTDFVLSTVMESPDLHDAMKRIAKSYNLVHGGAYNRVEKRRDSIVYIIDDKHFPYAFDMNGDFVHSLMEAVLIFLHALLSRAAGKDLYGYVRKIYTKRTHKSHIESFLAFWDAPVHHNAHYYALSYDLSVAHTPLRIGETDTVSASGVYTVVVKMISERERAGGSALPMTERVIESLEDGADSQTQVAKRLGVSVATLRRRLADEGQNFRALRHRILNERAKSLLRKHRHASDVAQELGFSDFRSFSRAFKQWNGVTPAAYARSDSE